MKTIVKEKLDNKNQSIEYELKNYKYWSQCLRDLEDNLYEIENEKTKISSPNYQEAIDKNSHSNKEKKLIELIVRQDEYLYMKNWIIRKQKFVEDFLIMLNEEDRYFIKEALIERKKHESNETIAMRFELTEGGVRYRINSIINEYIRLHIENREEK